MLYEDTKKRAPKLKQTLAHCTFISDNTVTWQTTINPLAVVTHYLHLPDKSGDTMV